MCVLSCVLVVLLSLLLLLRAVLSSTWWHLCPRYAPLLWAVPRTGPGHLPCAPVQGGGRIGEAERDKGFFHVSPLVLIAREALIILVLTWTLLTQHARFQFGAAIFKLLYYSVVHFCGCCDVLLCISHGLSSQNGLIQSLLAAFRCLYVCDWSCKVGAGVLYCSYLLSSFFSFFFLSLFR